MAEGAGLRRAAGPKVRRKWQKPSPGGFRDVDHAWDTARASSIEPVGRSIAFLERALSETHRILAAVLNAIPDSVEIIDRDFHIVEANQVASRYCGLSAGDLTGQLCYKVHAARTSPCRECPATEAFHTGKPSVAVHRRTRRDGESVMRRTSAHPLKDEHGRVIRMINISADVDAPAQQQVTASRPARLSPVTELAAGMAHRINNPLTAIIGSAQLLLRDLDADDPNHGAARTIERAGLRAKVLVEHLLRFSQQKDYNFKEVDINASIWSALAAVSPRLQQANIRIVTDLAADLPLVVASAKHLEILWVNLLLNARDAIERGQREGRISVVSTPNSDWRWITVRVRDSGCGIPLEHMEKLFDPFFTTKDPNEGAGLGLYACREIATAHNATIELESQPNQGTVVTVSIPIP